MLAKSIILLLEIAELLTPLPGGVPLRLTLEESRAAEPGFSPDYLATTVMPYLAAMTDIQHVIDEIKERPPTEVKILAITYGSITVDITGGIRDTVELILDTVVKWRRENKKKLAEYETLGKRIEIEQNKTVLASEQEQAPEQARLLRAQAEQQEIANEQARLENERARLENKKLELEMTTLTLAMIDEVKPGLPDEQRLHYAMKLLEPTRTVALSPLELTDVTALENPDASTQDREEPDGDQE